MVDERLVGCLLTENTPHLLGRSEAGGTKRSSKPGAILI